MACAVTTPQNKPPPAYSHRLLPFNPPGNRLTLKNVHSMDYAFVIFHSRAIVSHVVPRQPLSKIEGQSVIAPLIAARSELTFFVCYCCKLFCHPKKVISFNLSNFRTLCAKHPGWGVSS